MSEINNIVRDVRSGALPPPEIPGFAIWLMRKLFWPFIIIAVGGTTIAMMVTR